MQCPQCASPNPDDASYCEMCYEPFGKKASPAADCFSYPDVDLYFDTSGAKCAAQMVLADDGVYFFIDGAGREEVAQRGVDLDNETAEIQDEIAPFLAANPKIKDCPYYFHLAKELITGTKLLLAGTLEIQTADFVMGVGDGLLGLRSKDKIKDFFAKHGFPSPS